MKVLRFSTMKVIEFAVLAAVLCSPIHGDTSSLEDVSDFEDNLLLIYRPEIPTADPHLSAEVDKVFSHSHFTITENGTCNENIPCGYATFATAATFQQIFLKSNCDCPEGMKCFVNARQTTAYVYRCSQFRNETDPILNQVEVPLEFPVENSTRILRSASMFENKG
ncbi:uncharacterized protein LOC118196331 [Stegodyphus dumicola]|uniref:uncharacterized protein LOC118196331 n=1 Tax=Stegodyphus dumicola TaxID=202533 RepID=UPI0015B09518|nr:uncharacterized protein LOC118196331 [Stegodyphus dumicola]